MLGKFANRPIFRTIAATRVREFFVAAALALVVGISLLMTMVGLSPALGEFLAGVVLADSEYRHELESDIEPFKGLLLGIFFISIGTSLNFTLIGEKIVLIAALVAGLILIKWLILVTTGFLFRMPAQVIEPLISAVAISMFLAPLLVIAHEKSRAGQRDEDAPQRSADTIEHGENKVILAGFGRLGTDLGRFLILPAFDRSFLITTLQTSISCVNLALKSITGILPGSICWKLPVLVKRSCSL